MGEASKPAIYAIVNVADGKRYVGGTVDPPRRIRQHLASLLAGTHWNTYLQSAFTSQGIEEFMVEILECVPTDELRDAEQRWLDQTRAADRDYGYNMNSHARPGQFDAEIIARRAESQRGRKMQPHVIEALRKANTGRKLSSEHRAKMSALRLGTKRPPQTGAAISAALKGKQKTDTHLEHMRASLRSPESRAKARAAKIKFNDEIRAAVCADYARGVTKSDLAKQYGMHATTVTRIVRESSPDFGSAT